MTNDNTPEQEYEALLRARRQALSRGMTREAGILKERMVMLQETGSSHRVRGSVKSFGGLKDLAKGAGRGARSTLGLGGTLQEWLGKPEGAPSLPGPEDIDAGLEKVGVDPSILEGGEDTFLGRGGEFVGAGGPFAAPSIIRAGVTSGLKGVAKTGGKFLAATGAATVGSEAVGNMFEEFGLPRVYGNVTGAMMPWAVMSTMGRLMSAQSRAARAASDNSSVPKVA